MIMWPPPQYRERCYNPQSSLPHSTSGTDFCHHRFSWLVLELGINVIVENVLTSFTQDTVGASAGPFHCCVLFHGAFTPWCFHPSHRSFQFLLISPSEHPCISLFGIYIDTFLRIYPGVEFLGHRCMLNFIRNCQFSKMDKTYSHYLIPAMHGSSSCSISLFILGIFCLFNFIHSGGWEWYIVVIFISISLIIVNDVEPIFLCLLVICHFRNVQIFCLFKKKKKICLLISYYQVASVLDFYFDHKTFVRYSYHKYFLWVWSLHFHFMNGLFWRIPVFNFDEIQFIIFLWLMLLCPKKF